MSQEAALGPRVEGARGSEMRTRMQASKDAGDCDFCNVIAGRPARHTSPIALEGTDWVVTPNDFPYPGTSQHLLIIARQHVSDLDELGWEALAEGMQMFTRVKHHFGLTGYCLFGRLGDRELTAQTMPHLHLHITQSDGLPVSFDDVDPEWRAVIEALPNGMASDPDALKQLWEAISLWRSALEGKAVGIYPKLSNKAK